MRQSCPRSGQRRNEWQCISDNMASKRAAERFGFVFEGIFRNDRVTKGRPADTLLQAITAPEWPWLCAALAGWLAPSNFAPENGLKLRTLESFRSI